jgi:hypothetical protein
MQTGGSEKNLKHLENNRLARGLDGERGRNRTFNLLLTRQLLEINGFNGFQTRLLGRNEQL